MKKSCLHLACNQELEVQQAYEFTLETMPVQKDLRRAKLPRYDATSGSLPSGLYEDLNEGRILLSDEAMLLDRSCLVYGGALHGSIESFLSYKEKLLSAL